MERCLQNAQKEEEKQEKEKSEAEEVIGDSFNEIF